MQWDDCPICIYSLEKESLLIPMDEYSAALSQWIAAAPQLYWFLDYRRQRSLHICFYQSSQHAVLPQESDLRTLDQQLYQHQLLFPLWVSQQLALCLPHPWVQQPGKSQTLSKANNEIIVLSRTPLINLHPHLYTNQIQTLSKISLKPCKKTVLANKVH